MRSGKLCGFFSIAKNTLNHDENTICVDLLWLILNILWVRDCDFHKNYDKFPFTIHNM